MQIQEYRTRLEEFIESLHREYYLYYSGQKELLETRDFYSEFSDLFSLDRIREIRGEIEKTPPHFESLRKSLGKLHAFAVEHHLEQACATLMEEIAEFESKSTFPWEGKDIHYTQIPVALANVSESLRRRRLNEIRARALEQSNPLRKGRLDRLRAQVQALGYKTCLEAYQSIWGIDYRAFPPRWRSSLRLRKPDTRIVSRSRSNGSWDCRRPRCIGATSVTGRGGRTTMPFSRRSSCCPPCLKP